MNAKVILIQPQVGEWDWVRSSPHFPLGILQAAARVAEQFPTVFIDPRLGRHWEKEVEGHLQGSPLCVAVTSMSGRQIRYALAASRFVKERSRIPVVWGGLHASMLDGQTLANPNVDIVVRGEGEETFFELVRALDQGGSLEMVKGISFRRNGRIIYNPDRDLVPLDRLPEVPYHLAELKRYLPAFRGVPSLNMETSRGCPNRCTYCYNFRYNRQRWRAQGPERVLERLRHVVDAFGVKGIYFTDDNFFASVPRGLEIARRIREERLDIQWQLQGVEIRTIRDMSHEELDLLRASGCVRFSFGADSGSDRILRLLRKNHTVQDIIEINRRLADYDITIYYSLISGIPTETLDDLIQTKDLALQLTEENPHARTSPIYNYFPFPGAELYEEIISECGYVPPQTLEEWSQVDYGVTNIPYLSSDMRVILDRLYLPSLCIDRKFHEYNTSPLLRWVTDMYRPVARLRLRKMFFSMPCEKRAADCYIRWRERRW
jgi:anaerobic magnesium-protoporphyrin IX monomethyl ester cyclase